MPLLDRIYWGNSVEDWLVALGAAAGCFLLLALARKLFGVRLRKIAGRTSTGLDDAAAGLLASTRHFFLFLLSVKLASNFLSLSPGTNATLSTIAAIAFMLQGGIWLNWLITFWFERRMEAGRGADAAAGTSLMIVKFAGQLVLWTVLLLAALGTIGVNITAFITTLGIGGIAVALALQNVLGDLFASLAIALDKPFVVGDVIVMENHMGTVERIGMKTTRLRSIGGEQIVISNSELLKARIRNFKRMRERRVQFRIGVVYRTPPDDLERLPVLLKGIIESVPRTRFEGAHFMEYGEFSLNFDVVYHVLSPEYGDYADVQHAINLGILRAFREQGIEFPERLPAPPAAA